MREISNRPKPEMRHYTVGLGIVTGSALGLLFGPMLGDLILGIAIGAALGLVIGAMAQFR